MKTLLLALTLILSTTPQALAKGGWLQHATPEAAGFDRAALESARAFADESKSGAVFIASNGHAVAAWGAVDRRNEIFSVRKSLYSALWGIAEARGLVRLDATLEELGIDDLTPLTPAEKKARVIDLLHARSGVYHPSAYAPSDQEKALPARGANAPDTFWFYNNWDFNVAGVLLEKITGRPLGELFDEWIAKPIGMEDFRPSDVFAIREPGVSRWPALTFRMSARDLARFGLLWSNRGQWNGARVLPARWIERAWTATSNTGTPGQGYGLMWWTYEPGSIDAKSYPHASRVRLLLARGSNGQVIAVIPDADLVVVHVTDSDNGRRVSGRDVWTLIDRILGARSAAAPKTKARLSPLRIERFASELPSFQWPAVAPLDPRALESFAGEYDLGRGVAARVFIHEGRLYAFMPGRGEAELLPSGPAEFFVRVDPAARVRFEADRVLVSLGGRELTGTRKAASADPH